MIVLGPGGPAALRPCDPQGAGWPAEGDRGLLRRGCLFVPHLRPKVFVCGCDELTLCLLKAELVPMARLFGDQDGGADKKKKKNQAANEDALNRLKC